MGWWSRGRSLASFTHVYQSLLAVYGLLPSCSSFVATILYEWLRSAPGSQPSGRRRTRSCWLLQAQGLKTRSPCTRSGCSRGPLDRSGGEDAAIGAVERSHEALVSRLGTPRQFRRHGGAARRPGGAWAASQCVSQPAAPSCAGTTQVIRGHARVGHVAILDSHWVRRRPIRPAPFPNRLE